MSDEFDQASDLENLQREIAIKNASKSIPRLPLCGVCYNCADVVDADKRFCDADCRDDHERRNK